MGTIRGGKPRVGMNWRMVMKKIDFTRRRIAAVILTFALIFTCLPFMGNEAEAATPAPNYNGVFEVYSTYFNYFPFGGGNSYAIGLYGTSSTPLYMEYSADGVNWTRTGRMDGNYIQLFSQQGFCISGLQPDTVYHTRIWYGDAYGRQVSPARPTGAYKTGKATKPKIKKVTTKAVKVRRHKLRHPAGYYWYGSTLIYQKAWTERWYTYKVKTTVELKKKPGTAGIFINGKWVAGNKKKYKITETPAINYSAKHPRGRIKWNVYVYSGQDAGYGGYSPYWYKKKKLS